MAVKSVFILISVIAVAVISFQAYAEEAKLGRDDFVSSSIASVFDKLGEYTSGQKRLISDDATGANSEDEYAEQDAMGNTVTKPRPKLGRDAALNEPI